MTGYLIAVALQVGILMVLTTALNIQYGMTGLINFGLVAFYGLGAYATGLATIAGAPILLGLLLGMAVAAVAALPLGALAVRLRAEYLAIVTLGFGETVRLVAQNERWLTRGNNGLGGIPRPFADWPALPQGLLQIAVVALALIIVLLVMRRLTTSAYGRILQAIRDNEPAVAAIGKNANRFKVQILAYGAGVAGLAGALQAHVIGYVSPEQLVSHVTFTAWMAMILGGTGRTSGAVLGAAIVMAIFEGSRFARDLVPVISEVELASLRLAFVGLLLILFALYRPQGVMGDYEAK